MVTLPLPGIGSFRAASLLLATFLPLPHGNMCKAQGAALVALIPRHSTLCLPFPQRAAVPEYRGPSTLLTLLGLTRRLSTAVLSHWFPPQILLGFLSIPSSNWRLWQKGGIRDSREAKQSHISSEWLPFSQSRPLVTFQGPGSLTSYLLIMDQPQVYYLGH